jgi:hypothetical protein
MCISQNYESYFEDFKMIIERAIQNRHLLAFTYDGFSRTVGFARLPEIQQNFLDACKVGADEILVIFNIGQWVHDLFAELQVLRPHILCAPTLQCFGTHAPAGSQFDFVQGCGHAGRSLMSRSCIHAYFGAEVE